MRARRTRPKPQGVRIHYPWLFDKNIVTLTSGKVKTNTTKEDRTRQEKTGENTK